MVFNKVGYVIFGRRFGRENRGSSIKNRGSSIKNRSSIPPMFSLGYKMVTNWILSYLDRGLKSRDRKGGGRVDV